MIRTYVISILGFLSFGILLYIDVFPDWMSYVFYIGVALFGLITTSQFWLLANLIFSSLEAKRLFGFIGAGAIAGGISGGYLTSLFTQFMESKHLLFVAAGLLIISMVINQKIWATYLPTFDLLTQNKKSKTLHEYPLRLIRNSKHLSYLALIIGISVVVAKLVEFQFSAIASENIKDPNKLTAYFGFWFSTSNVVALGIQLLITQRMVGFLGVGRSLFILPGALFISTAVLLRAPVLWAGTTLKLMDISLKQSINKAATELLILPVPMAIKSQAKTFIDVFVDTTATGIGGIMLIFLINGLNLSVRAVSILILLLISLWMFFAVRARNEYILAFQKQLGINPQPLKKKELLLSNVAVVDSIRQTVLSGSTEKILVLLSNIEESKDPGLMRELIPLLQHESPRVRKATLDSLYYHTDPSITKQIEPLLNDPDDIVRSRAFSCLLAHTRQNRVRFINDHLTHEDPAISGAALVGLATESRDNPVMQKQFNLEERLLEKIIYAGELQDKEDIVVLKILVARAIGYGRIEGLYPLLMSFMIEDDPTLNKQAIIAAGNTKDSSFVKSLLPFLPNEATRITTQKALAKYKPADLLVLLTEVSNTPGTPTEILLQLPALAEAMDTQQAVDFLFSFLVLHHNPKIKLEVLEVLHKIKTKFPHLTITGKRILPFLMKEADLYKDSLALGYSAEHSYKNHDEDPEISVARKELIVLLEQKLDLDLKRIFWTLGLSYPPGQILPLFNDLRNPDPDIRISTVELLDNILEPQLKKVVLSIVETAMLEKLSDDDLERLELSVPNEIACYESLLQGTDEELKLAVIKLIHALKNPEIDNLLQDSA